jgi:putative iron-dependent peroxidase
MLEHMFVGDPPGNHDRILDFSTAVTGNLFFVPTAAFLDDLPPAPGATDQQAAGPGADADTTAAGSEAAVAGGSLGIAGLKGTVS